MNTTFVPIFIYCLLFFCTKNVKNSDRKCLFLNRIGRKESEKIRNNENFDATATTTRLFLKAWEYRRR